MKKKSLRVLSLIVAIVMAISILPLAALAEETGPKRQVGVVVYGSELTALLTDMEKGMNDLQDGISDLGEGNIDLEGGIAKAGSALERLQTLATDIGTKVANGSGISVPDVDLEITSKTTDKTYKLKEDSKIELFTETVETYVPFQQDVEKQINQIQTKMTELQNILKQYDILNLLDTFDSLTGSLTDLSTDLVSLTQDIVGSLASLTGMNGALYRTYVTEEALPVGEYTVTVKGFYDSDENNNAITRDGYILYNDGLEENGSGFNTERSFDVTVQEKGMFDHDIQFVGPANGIIGKFDIPEPLNSVYNTAADLLNTIADTMEGLLDNLTGKDTSSLIGKIAGFVTDITAKITNTEELLDWLRTWETPRLKTGDDLDLSYKFAFPGLWCAESDAGFTFTNVDVADTGITGSNFLLVNRDETLGVLKMMLDLGKETLSAVLKSTFGYTDEESGEKVEGMLSLYTQLLKTEDGQFNIDYDVAYDIIKNYIAVISQMDLLDKVVDTNTGDLLTPVKLRNPIPAILMATSDENGQVTFSKNSNMTLTWMLQIIPQVTEALGKTDLANNEILKLLLQVADYAADLTAEYGDAIINTLVYPFAQRLGLVGQKMGSGKYIMFQIKAADDYWVNPLAYTMILTWENDTWLYVTVADLGIIVPYFAEGFYDFVRNTTFAGTIDSFLSRITGQNVNVITDILTDKIDITKEFGKVLTGALTAFVGTLGFDSLGVDNLFATRSDFISGINQYLYENGRTAQNLMIYINKQAQRAKSVYAGYVDEDWYFYNLDKSPTLTATKLIDKSTKNIAAAFVNEQKAGAVTTVGNTVSKVVNNIGTSVEKAVQNVKTQIKSTIGAAVQNVIKNIGTTIKNTITSVFKNIFAKFTGSALITFNA